MGGYCKSCWILEDRSLDHGQTVGNEAQEEMASRALSFNR